MNETIILNHKLQKKGLNLHTLSLRSGVSYSTIYNLFTGKKSIRTATSESVYKIAATLETTMDNLYTIFTQKEFDHKKPLPNFMLMWQDEEMGFVQILDEYIHIDGYISHPVKQIFYKDTLSRFEFGNIITSRCWDKNRPDIQILLEQIGLQEYNPYEICKKTHAVMFQDKTWFRFEGEHLSYTNVKGKKPNETNSDSGSIFSNR